MKKPVLPPEGPRSPRVPYRPHDAAGPEEMVAPIRMRRGGTLLNLDRILLHSPPLAIGWNGLLGAVRNEFLLPVKLRELAICAVGVATGADYEVYQHRPEFLKAGGSEEQIAALSDLRLAASDGSPFEAIERIVLRMTFELTQEAHVSDSTFAAARAALPDDRQVVELVGLIAAYNMVARFINALGIQPE